MNTITRGGMLGLLAALAATSAVLAQGSEVKILFSDANVPTSMKLKDLNHDWRRFKLVGQLDLPTLIAQFSEMSTPGAGILYTRYESVTMNTETYLIAYQAPTKPIDLAMMMGAYGRKPAPKEKLSPDTTLVLSLINLRTAGSLTEVQPFDLDRELAASHEQDVAAARLSAGQQETEAISSLSVLNSAETQYRIKNHRYGSLTELTKTPNMYVTISHATTPATAQQGYYYTLRLDPKHPGVNYFAVATPVKKEYSRVLYTDEVGVVYGALNPPETITTDHNGKAPGPHWTVASIF